MDLYHFTKPEFVDAIMREGLVPADGSTSDSAFMLAGHKAVWLTAVPTLTLGRAARKKMLLKGALYKRNSSILPLATVCLQVRIPSHDRQLKQFNKWADRKNPDAADAVLFANHWLYFGVVDPHRITVHKHVQHVPYSVMPEARAAHEAGITNFTITDERLNYYLDGEGAA